jgi:hypothetical protein
MCFDDLIPLTRHSYIKPGTPHKAQRKNNNYIFVRCRGEHTQSQNIPVSNLSDRSPKVALNPDHAENFSSDFLNSIQYVKIFIVGFYFFSYTVKYF